MKGHALPWRRDGARIIRKDGVAIIEGWSHHDPSCRGCRCGAKTMALTESVDYAIACVNALAGKNPDALGRFVLQAKMALEVLEAGPESVRVGARALRKAMEDFGRETP